MSCGTSLLVLAGVLATSAFAADTPLQQRVASYLQPRAQTAATDVADPALVEKILARPDPGTFFLRYAFALQRHAKTLLSDAQSKRLAEVMQRHTPVHLRWHDERNALRCKFNAVLWRYVAAGDAEAPALRCELTRWMDLRMQWTQQEHLAQYRFARAVWSVLDAPQQTQLLNGEWKAYVKRDTGHTHDDATAKLLGRALDKPDQRSAFDAAVAVWAAERTPRHAALRAAEERERRIVFAMDLNSEALAGQANQAVNTAFAKLYLAEAEAFRRIVKAGYKNPAPACGKAATEAWNEAHKRFSNGAGELLDLLERP